MQKSIVIQETFGMILPYKISSESDRISKYSLQQNEAPLDEEEKFKLYSSWQFT